MMEIADYLIEMQKKTIDLSARNNLINFKVSKNVICVTFPNSEELINKILDGKKIDFPYINEFDFESSNKIVYSSRVIHTSIDDSSQMMKTLRLLKNKQKIIQQEKGINSLFLAVGFMKWCDNTYSNMINYSPILLIPIKLINEKITDPFSIELESDDVIINPALIMKLKNDFGITIDNVFDGNYNNLLNQFEEICKNTNWTIEDKAYIGIFSFFKINIYEDYKKNINNFKSSQILQMLLDGKEENNYFEYNFDEMDVQDNPLAIFDADSSQLEAIANANNGLSFILQGPPGTGKSQTISNIIANSIANGKKVLFVSEKMAALDIVLKKMKESGLSEFCLNLHDIKRNKKAILDDFQIVINEIKNSYKLSDEAILVEQELEESRNKLNHYCKAIYEKIEQLDISLYEAFGILADTESIPYMDFYIQSIDKIDKNQYLKMLACVDNLAKCKFRLPCNVSDNPWNRYKHKDKFSLNLEYHFIEKEKQIYDIIKLYNNYLIGLLNQFKITVNNICELNEFCNNLTTLNSINSIPRFWINNFNKESLNYVIENTIQCQKQLNDDIKKYNEFSKRKIIDSISQEEVNELINIIDIQIKENYLFFYWYNNSINNLSEEFINICINKQKIIIDTEKLLCDIFYDSIFEIDYSKYLYAMSAEYNNFFKRLSNQYKKDKYYLNSFLKYGKKLSRFELINYLKIIKENKEAKNWFFNNESQLKYFFGKEFYSYNSNFDNFLKQFNEFLYMIDSKNKLKRIKEDIKNCHSANTTFKQCFDIEFIESTNNFKDLLVKINLIDDFKSKISDKCFKLILEGFYFDNEKEKFLKNIILDNSNLNSSLHGIYDWYKSNFIYNESYEHCDFNNIYNHVKNCCKQFNLLKESIAYDKAILECEELGLSDFVARTINVSPKLLKDIFKKCFFTQLVEKVISKNDFLSHFDSINQDEIVNQFRKLDKKSILISRSKVKCKVIDSMPPYIRNDVHYGEINILEKEIMKTKRHMPLRSLFNSISNILQTLKPCIMMSPQTVSTYLDFEKFKFDLVVFDEASQISVENSIPSIARAKQVIIAGDSMQLPPTNFFNTIDSGELYDDKNINCIGESILEEFYKLPILTLRWHYRSKNESLIDFSNKKFYSSSLITFPSPLNSKKNEGLEFIYCKDGKYDRGGTSGNIEEAKLIAEIVIEHIQSYPQRSLGVIAFGSVQQDTIENEIRKIRYNNPQYEFFFDEKKSESFFIKNLETVQGDERDTIIISIGYGKDYNNNINLNFGPLNQIGGEKRLNVAITRSRINCKVVSSLLPSELNIDQCKNIGPKILKSYLEYANNGGFVNIENNKLFDSPFEESVYNFLISNNYDVDTQVGTSNYKIDLAIKDLKGNYCLGIECDGKTYHSEKTARDRDRLRQDILCSMGWRIYRIWSTDWIKNNKFEKERLLKTIENLPENQSEYKELERSEEIFTTTIEKDLTSDLQFYGIEKQNYAIFDNVKFLQKKELIIKIITNFFPVHYEYLRKLFIDNYFGYYNKKSSVEFEVTLNELKSEHQIVEHELYYYPIAFKSIVPHLPNNRKMTQVSCFEIASCMKIVLNKHKMSYEELSKEVARLYGFLNCYNQIVSQLMNDAYDFVINNKEIVLLDGKISVLTNK